MFHCVIYPVPQGRAVPGSSLCRVASRQPSRPPGSLASTRTESSSRWGYIAILALHRPLQIGAVVLTVSAALACLAAFLLTRGDQVTGVQRSESRSALYNVYTPNNMVTVSVLVA